VLAKATIALTESDPTGVEAFAVDSVRSRTAEAAAADDVTCFMNLAPWLEAPMCRSLCIMDSPTSARGRRRAAALRRSSADSGLDVRHRALVSPVRRGARREGAEPLSQRHGQARRPGAGRHARAAPIIGTDGGHALDFVNKALEALDVAGSSAEALASLPMQIASARRMEESNARRNPVDLVAHWTAPSCGLTQYARGARGNWPGRSELVEHVLGDDPAACTDAMLEALREGADEVELASVVSFAAATRIARFPTTNEFGDWDTALHTFTFANAVEQGLRRAPSRELLRGVFDAAMSVYLDRFLNVPATRLPKPGRWRIPRRSCSSCLPSSTDNSRPAGELVASYLASRPTPVLSWPRLAPPLSARIGTSTRSSVEAAVRQ
jgi:hypothetical protein